MEQVNRSPEYKGDVRHQDYPERQVGFPERNDVAAPIEDMERLHVDLDTLDLTRTTVAEMARATFASPIPVQQRR